MQDVKEIVSACFKRRGTDEFGGKPYHYYTDIPLKVGDIVKVPTIQGMSVAKVRKINVHISEVPLDVRPEMRTIKEYAEEREVSE